jgi:phage terminase large subunit-like protein
MTRSNSWSGFPAPRFSTARNLSRATYGPRVAEVARALGKPLMPWQQHVADVALEVDPSTGRLAYRECIVTIPRQSGKSSLALAIMVHRAIGFGEPQRIAYTAQTRGDARKLWEDEHIALLADSPFRAMHTVRRQIGQESIRWHAPRSIHSIVAPNEAAAHGQTLDLGVVDEAWAVSGVIEQGMSPAMITRPQPQLWITSTAGTPCSEWLRSKVDAGRLQPDG